MINLELQQKALNIMMEVKKVIIGKDDVIKKILTSFLARGHILLDDIPGVGPARRKALMRHFASIADIKEASVEALMEIPEIPQSAAEEIYRFFRKNLS